MKIGLVHFMAFSEPIKGENDTLNIGYQNTAHPPIVSVEVKPFGAEYSDVVIANAKRTLNAAWVRV